MAAYSVTWKASALKELNYLPPRETDQIIAVVETLAVNPHSIGSIKLSGVKNRYRIRVGNYRVIYGVENQELVVIVVKVAHRREVYRGEWG